MATTSAAWARCSGGRRCAFTTATRTPFARSQERRRRAAHMIMSSPPPSEIASCRHVRGGSFGGLVHHGAADDDSEKEPSAWAACDTLAAASLTMADCVRAAGVLAEDVREFGSQTAAWKISTQQRWEFHEAVAAAQLASWRTAMARATSESAVALADTFDSDRGPVPVALSGTVASLDASANAVSESLPAAPVGGAGWAGFRKYTEAVPLTAMKEKGLLPFDGLFAVAIELLTTSRRALHSDETPKVSELKKFTARYEEIGMADFNT